MHVMPSPMTFAIVNASTPNGIVVMLRVETVIGSLMFLLDPDLGEKIGVDLTRTCRQARTGLILPTN